MRFFWVFLLTLPAWAQEAFKVQVHDRHIRVEAPVRFRPQYAVVVENLSLSDLTGKFLAGGKDLKFVAVKSGESRTVEFTHDGKFPVRFRPLAPAFQEVSLEFGKGPYEIPPKQ
jgi:hypothetical protein